MNGATFAALFAVLAPLCGLSVGVLVRLLRGERILP